MGSLSQNVLVLKFDLNSPGLVTFGTNLTHFELKSDIPDLILVSNLSPAIFDFYLRKITAFGIGLGHSRNKICPRFISPGSVPCRSCGQSYK